jgi:probable phosphoglycerate mutase
MPLSLKPGITLYFCRHGETEANVERRFQGQTRDTPLTDQGRKQSRGIAALLREHDPHYPQLDYVCSPLPRARQTMQIVRECLGLSPNAYSTDQRLVEIDLGFWDGLTDTEARARDPAAYVARTADKWAVPVPGGENYAKVAGRCEDWIADMRTDTFAVTHGAFTRVLRGLLQGLTWQQMCSLDETQGILFRVRGNTVERFEHDGHG